MRKVFAFVVMFSALFGAIVASAADLVPLVTGTAALPVCTGTNKAYQYDDVTHLFSCATILMTATDVGLGNVTNDTQLKRSANDWTDFTLKAVPASGDVLLIEDSAAAGAKKKITVGTLPTGGGGSGTVGSGTDTQAVRYNGTGTVLGPSTGQTLSATQLLSQNMRITALSATTTLTSAHGPVIACTAGATDKTMTLPAASTTLSYWKMKKMDSGVGQCLFAPATGERINGTVNGTVSAPVLNAEVEIQVVDVTTPNWGAVAGMPFNGVSGNIVSFGANNVPTDSGVAVAGVSRTIASGSKALATSVITSGTCTAAQTATATGTATTDVVQIGFNGDPSGVTGFIPSTAGMLTILAYPTTNTLNLKVCNNTAASITPGAVTLNWRVMR